MADFKIRGVVPPVTVPDTDDHQLDVPSFERVINRMIDAGVDGLFFLGSTGEKRHLTYPKWGHERVNDFEDALMAFLVAPWDSCPSGARGGGACDGSAGGIG